MPVLIFTLALIKKKHPHEHTHKIGNLAPPLSQVKSQDSSSPGWRSGQDQEGEGMFMKWF